MLYENKSLHVFDYKTGEEVHEFHFLDQKYSKLRQKSHEAVKSRQR